ncbi:glycoside hydrolase family 43 protein [Hymenobacter cellulosivorans]|uniref:Glycoside hydrolase 43 family protein n=1 Tax=Hymenobacter cellulosivorans TaxID=2932249 RepID=A0ABY4FG34_9BACT|nr:glycoside hydrolase 43 family protein [Hymenobacter cellulosivorans]UOQ54917.1 glycoside hydrolase 43 family protein [Hymenobacter cellulosivorans]
MVKSARILLLAALVVLSCLPRFAAAQQASLSKVWVPDLGNGTYKNPVLYADYSDPDVVRVGNDYYLTSSSFNAVPGLQVLHSTDLVNWTIIGAAFTQQPPQARYDLPQHGNGVWAPAIRYHKKKFYIYYPDPDLGIYVTRADNPAGPWEAPILVKAAKGWIDPCPLWDEDGKAYLVHGFAGSRAGFKSVLAVSRMSPDGLSLLGDDVLVFDGHEKHPTIEGPKFYKRKGYYYIMAPGGGVPTGWQVVMRSKNVFGPYEDRIVMDQGKTPTNGPHQGAWIDTPSGEDWFMHFQDQGPYGRVVHLQPMTWKNDWPVIGTDTDGDGKGEPVLTFRKPASKGKTTIATPATSDEFDSNQLGLQWQWHANPQVGWVFPTGAGYLRLYSVPLPEGFKNFWQVPNLLLQKLPAEVFTVTTKLTFTPRFEGEKTGLIMMGMDYAYLSVTNQGGKLQLSQTTCQNADKGGAEATGAPVAEVPAKQPVYLRVAVTSGAKCQFSYSLDGQTFQLVGNSFQAREGKWIGAKVGLFCTRAGKTNDAGAADVDWFRIE